MLEVWSRLGTGLHNIPSLSATRQLTAVAAAAAASAIAITAVKHHC